MGKVLIFCCTILFAVEIFSFPSKLLYDFSNIGTSLPNLDDVSSPEIKLKVPIVFYGQKYSSIFVNSNGLLSFQTDIPTFFNIEFPLDYPVIAPLYSNIDISSTGIISYYETNNPEILERATRNVRDSFSFSEDFHATSVVIVTWSSVGYYKEGSDKLNTFQVAIISDGDDSFVEFLYPENGIQWIQGTGDESGLPDARSQAGFVAADGRFYLLQGSGTDQVRNLEKWSNVNIPGQWIFRIGQVDQDANVEEPDIFNDVLENGIPKSCEKGSSYCHGFAKCVDYTEGFCCVCRKQYYGNGKFCVKKDVPLRVNGKVNGKINDEKLQNLDLQSYIVMADGRAYTAISKIPESIGYDIQSLQILGGTLGWVFSKPVSDAINGFHLTGGLFNHTATIVFMNTNQKITIRQKYVGLDVFDQLKLEVDAQGNIPHIPDESKVKIEEYEEQYTLTALGVIQSSSKRTLSYTNFDGTEITIQFTVDQNFIFDHCKFENSVVGTTWRLKVGKNFISYEATEQIVRFGLSSKISPIGDIDPCTEGRVACGSNSACVVEDDSYRCICNPGYQYIYKDNNAAECDDINECQTGLHDCDSNAQCFNEIGSYNCRCKPGFEGDGRYCENSRSCNNVQCPENSECIENGLAVCECIPGFTGNGQICSPLISQSCHIANNCSPFGVCTINSQTNAYTCVCLPGYAGNGYICQEHYERETTTEIITEPPVTAQCLFSVCWCASGYKLQNGTNYCEKIEDVEVTTLEYTSETESETEPISYPEVQCFNNKCFCPRGFYLNETSSICLPKLTILHTMGFSGSAISCNEINNCHQNAECIYQLNSNSYQCICNFGFEGNGYNCLEADVSCTTQTDICDIHATCTYSDLHGKSICICDYGYEGNGRHCYLGGCKINDDCPLNEQCVYSADATHHECVCKEGFIRDSQKLCVPSGTCGGGRCDANAECLFDNIYQTSYCKCKENFIGDGINECKRKPLECNVVNDCSTHATCIYNHEQEIHQCQCNEGYVGDGLICNVEQTCQVNPYICDRQAICLLTSDRKYICQCEPGFSGNGTFCKEIPKQDGNFLFVNQGKATLRIPYDASQKHLAKLIYINEFQTAVGLDVDCTLGKVYWSDISGRVIKSSNYNGSNVTDFMINDIGSPEGLSVDWVSRNIYWTDSTKDTIEVANLDTNLRTTLFNTSLINPRGIAVHPQRGKIFWTDWDRKHPKIEWANADGTGREIFLQGDSVQLPNSLAIDFELERLCYADAGTKSIECLDIDSRYKQTIATNCTYPFGITVTNEHIYWTDWIIKKIERVDKRSLQRLKPLEVPLGGTNKLYGVVAVPQNCIGLSNACQYYTTQCPQNHICLPNSQNSKTCICAENAISSSESTRCPV